MHLFADAKKTVYETSAYQVGMEEKFRVILQPELNFLRPFEENLSYARAQNEIFSSGNSGVFVPSIRVSLGFQTTYDFNDLIFSYTRYHTKQKTSLKREGLVPINWFLQELSTVNSLQTLWRVEIDSLEAVCKKSLLIGKFFQPALAFGLKGGVFKQKFQIDAADISSFNRSNSWFLGPRFQLFSTFLFPYGFYFGFEGALDLLYTDFSLSHREKGTNPQLRNLQIKQIAAEQEMSLSLGFSRLMSKEVHVNFALKGLVFFYPDQNQMTRLFPSNLSGNFSLLGMGLFSRFDF